MKKRNWVHQHLFLLTTCILVVSLLLPGCGGGEAVVEKEEETPEGPFFELKELRTSVTRSDGTEGKLFYLTYSTNLDAIKVKVTAPDGSVSEPSPWSGSGEQERGILIPPRDDHFYESEPEYYFSILEAHIALTGTYKFTVYDESGATKIWEEDFTFQGAKLVVEDARVTEWDWEGWWPVCLFFTEEITVTISNQGDLPSCAIIVIRFDDLNRPDDEQAEWLKLGFVAAGETRTFVLGDGSHSFMAKVNYKTSDLFVPPSSHTLSVRLVGDLPSPGATEGFSQESLQYYRSSQCPYPIVKCKLPGIEPELLLLDDYSTIVETPTPRVQT